MRRVGKQIVAITLAAAMMGSLTPEACTFLQNEIVYAAETNEASAPTVTRTELYKNEGAKTTKTIDFSELKEDDWNGEGKITFAYDESINGSLGNVNEEYELTAKVTLDETSYQSLDADKAHLNIQGVTKLGSNWGWNNSTDCQWLQKDSFTKDGENYSADLKVKFSGITPDTLMDVEFVLVGTGFKGTVTFSNVVLINLSSDKQELTKQEPTVLSNLNDASQVSLWAGETGYQYFHGGTKNAAPELSYDANGGDGRLKVSLNYTANSGESWSEAKVKFTPETPADISNYNQVSVDLIYPENSNISKIKFFSNSGINKDTSIDSSEAVDAGNGYKKVTVTLGFSPSATPMDDLTIGLIGANSSFAGDVYLDNLILSQKDAGDDFVAITATPNTDGTQAKPETTDKTMTMTDPDASNSAKALYAYLQGLTESDQVLFGHQNDVSHSVGNNDLGDVKDVTGSVSGIFGIDSLALFGSEAGGTDAASALQNSIDYSKKAAQNGAIVTLSTHMPNFTNAKIKKNADGTYDFYNCDFNEAKDLSGDSLKKILPGGEKNEVFKAYLDTIAFYANALEKENIPVIFRPFHEDTGGWFWWGAKGAEPYKALYKYLYEQLTNVYGCHNLIWVWNGQSADWYPGDEYVDIIGEDIYVDKHSYTAHAAKFSEILDYSGGKKIIALTENGTIFDIDNVIATGAKWAWFTTWNGSFMTANGQFSEEYTEAEVLKKDYQSAYVITLDELPDWESLKNGTLRGDANKDGSFNIADAVLLQKWLLAVPDTVLPDWKAADLCEDGVLNVCDLCAMRQELTNG